jgi:hypothetical protein
MTKLGPHTRSSCDRCRRLKIKCIGRFADHPLGQATQSCEKCTQLSDVCVVTRLPKRRGPPRKPTSAQPASPSVSPARSDNANLATNEAQRLDIYLPDATECTRLAKLFFSREQLPIQFLHPPSFLLAMEMGTAPPLLLTGVVAVGSWLEDSSTSLLEKFTSLIDNPATLPLKHPCTVRGPDPSKLYPAIVTDDPPPTFELLQCRILMILLMCKQGLPRNRMVKLCSEAWLHARLLRLFIDPIVGEAPWSRSSPESMALPWSKLRQETLPQGLGLTSSSLDQEVRRRTMWAMYCLDCQVGSIALTPFNISISSLHDFTIPCGEELWNSGWIGDIGLSCRVPIEDVMGPCEQCRTPAVDAQTRALFPSMDASLEARENAKLGALALPAIRTFLHREARKLEGPVPISTINILLHHVLSVIHSARVRNYDFQFGMIHLENGIVVQHLGHLHNCIFPAWLRALYSANGSKENVTTEFLNGVSQRGMTVAEAILSANDPQVSYDSDYERGQGSIMLYNWILILTYGIHSIYWFAAEDVFQDPLLQRWMQTTYADKSFEACATVANLLNACKRVVVFKESYPPVMHQRNIAFNPMLAVLLFHVGQTILVALRASINGLLSPASAHFTPWLLFQYFDNIVWGLEQVGHLYPYIAHPYLGILKNNAVALEQGRHSTNEVITLSKQAMIMAIHGALTEITPINL